MFGKKRKTDLICCANDLVGGIGKLPLHTEFIKHRIVQAEIAQLDQWYQNAYHQLMRQYGNDMKAMFLRMPLQHFIYTAPAGKFPLIGTSIASQDQSGRAYPFVLFRLIEHPVAHEFQSLVPTLYHEYFLANEALCSSDWRNYTLPDLYDRINRLNQLTTSLSRRSALEISLEGLKTITLADFWQELIGNYPELQPTSFVNAILRLLALIKDTNLAGNGIRLPIMSGPRAHISVVFWLQLIQSVLPDKQSRLQLFWSTGNAYVPPALLVYHKQLTNAVLSHFIERNSEQTELYDVVLAAQQPQAIADIAQELAAKMDLSLLQALELWSKRQI